MVLRPKGHTLSLSIRLSHLTETAVVECECGWSIELRRPCDGFGEYVVLNTYNFESGIVFAKSLAPTRT